MNIDARNGCYGNEEATADDGATESGMYSQKGDCPHVGVSALPSDAKGNTRFGASAIGSPSTEAPKYDGNLLPAMTAMVTGFVDKLAKFYSPCPQGDDCAGDGKHYRIFACDHCSFVGCCACLDLHEAGGHESDSSAARERIGYEY